ncbi:MAG: hypothetical protein WBV39_04740 [Rudaea sp.]
MTAIRIIATLLLVAGVLGLAYGGFSYAMDRHETKPGPIDMALKDTQTVNIPVWAGLGAIVIGGLLLTAGKKTKPTLVAADQTRGWTPDDLERSRKDAVLRPEVIGHLPSRR